MKYSLIVVVLFTGCGTILDAGAPSVCKAPVNKCDPSPTEAFSPCPLGGNPYWRCTYVAGDWKWLQICTARPATPGTADINMDPRCPSEVSVPRCFWRLNLAQEINWRGQIVKQGDCLQICPCDGGWCITEHRTRSGE
jgi:hypothetical protein